MLKKVSLWEYENEKAFGEKKVSISNNAMLSGDRNNAKEI